MAFVTDITDGSTLTNKYCEAGVRERTLIRSWFVKVYDAALPPPPRRVVTDECHQ